MAVSNRKITYCFLSIAAVVFFYMLPSRFELVAADVNTNCFSRCEKLSSSARRVCVENCAKNSSSDSKERSAAKKPTVKEKMEKCEEVCASYDGLDKAKCRRICLDNYDEFEKAGKEDDNSTEKKDAAEETKDNKCEKRCSMLSEPHKSDCLLKCKRISK